MAVAPSKQEMAAPMAVSSWITFVDFLSRGSTVLSFFITGRGMAPPALSNKAFNLTRSTHKLLVLKYPYFEVSWNAFSSSSGHCADSRRVRPPDFFTVAKWPPFLSASVRTATSIMKGAPVLAKCVSNLRSIVAPKLSELETKAYCRPAASSLSRTPLPSIAGYKSPCPGGHHSLSGPASQVAGVKSAAVTFGALFCTNSRSAPVPNAGYLESASNVSVEVAKEFMSMNLRSGDAYVSFIQATCLAIKSRNVLPSTTGRSDFAFSRPMPVPSPPFNLRMTVFFKSSAFGSMANSS
mmetsp:Transcript_110629/g.202761  ORF Transcript_110629/g.202761 Transcript_110629/m.202761 type:complete len:295 (-) Transcript_110629:236-1120(-)